MGKHLSKITPDIQKFIENQTLYFVGTARAMRRVNISPKGMDSLRIINPNTVVWFNLTGSGNETKAHLMDNQRMTLMFCSFDKDPLIVRLYGSAKFFSLGSQEYERLSQLFPPFKGGRQIIELTIDLVGTSCGWGVPIMRFVEDRNIHQSWASEKGIDGMEAYRKKYNSESIDGYDISQ